MNNDPSKPIKNSLFNPNVTGNTYEDFAQHAVLFPAQQVQQPTPPPEIEEPLPPSYTVEPDYSNQAFGEIPIQSQNPTGISASQYFIDQDYSQSFQQPEQQNQSNITSFISSLSNIWTRSSPQPAQEQIAPPLQQTDPFYVPYQSPTLPPQPVAAPLPPVSLYSPTDIPKSTISGAPPQTGPSNTYRRTGPKRAVYAPIPGLSSAAPEVPLPTNPPPVASFNQALSPANYFTPAQTPSSELSIFPEALRPPSSLTPKAFPEIPRPASSITPIFEAKSSETNSPFLSPVQDLPIFPNVDSIFPPPSIPTMPINEVSSSSASNLPYAYRQDNFLPTASADVNNAIYRPVYHHWFHKKQTEGHPIWEPFSMHDSQTLETAFTSPDLSPETVVATDGGRFDVNILRRERMSVYWKSNPTEVQRCSWFHKGTSDGKYYVPFDENVATKLEDEFKMAVETNQWHRKVELSNGETVIYHGVDVLVLFPASPSPDAWGNSPQNQPRPRGVKRGMDEFDIDEGESETVDHLLFMVHGIGAACDLKFRNVEEVVDEFRSIALQLVRSHYRSSCDRKVVNRVEILPISWHEKLHSEDTGIDEKLKSITLESIPKLREFTNDTLLDILFYTSPIFGQTIISSVGNELNNIYDLFKQRNPGYNGGVSLGGHSLGSLILFDLLCHQHPPSAPEKTENELNSDEDAVSPLIEKPPPMQRRMSGRISYMMGSVGTGQPEITYPQLAFQPLTFFALGSPIGMFVTIRGLDNLGEQFVLPTCPGFFNIFHPYDPVAYRVESLVNPELATLKPVLIPHHKGRKRMHLELKETMTRVGADLKQKLIDSMKGTWNSLFQMGWSKPQQMQPNLEAEVDKVLQEGFTKDQIIPEESAEQVQNEKTDLCLGLLNKGRRIDYVLQEAPVEFFNEYIFTLSSHLCYWESEDTILMILKEVYDTLNVTPDNQIPQQTMTIERPPSSPMSGRSQMQQPVRMGVDPTLPIKKASSVGPPPVSGFVRKS